jgi:hypothetical protein
MTDSSSIILTDDLITPPKLAGQKRSFPLGNNSSSFELKPSEPIING